MNLVDFLMGFVAGLTCMWYLLIWLGWFLGGDRKVCDLCGKNKRVKNMRGTTCHNCRVKLGYNP